MRKNKILAVSAAVAAAALLAACATPSSSSGPMSFFVTSAGSGAKGGDLGGLAGADATCQRLASSAGAGGKTWRAYLSTPPALPSATAPGSAAVNARDRIGAGPWYNAKGVLIARNVEHLHDGNNIGKDTALDERGNMIKGRGDAPNEHDMLTGSRADGTAFAPQTDTSCKGWTSSTDGSAIVGHHDRIGPNGDNWAKSWNFSHQSAGCNQQALISTGGAGRFYCFASN
ncbi:MAG: lectin [Comamonadaceae bacterium]|nr:MAG: lectin [Comamonadaceae bacterium]